MVVALYAFVALAVVFAVAAVVVGREARRLDSEPPRATFDLDEATEWVGNHLPYEVSAVLSYDDVRQVIEWGLELLRAKDLSSSSREVEVVVDREEAVAFALGRAQAAGSDLSEGQVAAVVEAQFGYFDAIGAIGPEAAPDDRPD
jgi:hypothetical protein